MAPLLWRLSGIRALRPHILGLAFRFEGGQFYSLTARRVFHTHYGVSIGDYSYGGCFVRGAFPPGVQIGRYVSIGPEVRVFLRNHPLDRLSTHPFFYNRMLGFVSEDSVTAAALEIGHDAWVGAGVVILRGCSRIGVGAAIGAGAIVTKDVPDFAVAVGNPARVIRRRFPPETCRLILASRWWDRPVAECITYLKEMATPLEAISPPHPLLRSRESERTQPQGAVSGAS